MSIYTSGTSAILRDHLCPIQQCNLRLYTTGLSIILQKHNYASILLKAYAILTPASVHHQAASTDTKRASAS